MVDDCSAEFFGVPWGFFGLVLVFLGILWVFLGRSLGVLWGGMIRRWRLFVEMLMGLLKCGSGLAPKLKEIRKIDVSSIGFGNMKFI